MHRMFSGCSSLKKLNINSFNTKNITDMYGMFYECSSLTKLNINNFNTDNVTNMQGMLYGCLKKTIMKIKKKCKNISKEAFYKLN